MKVIDSLLVRSWPCLDFYPRTFLRSGEFHDDEINWFQKRDHGVNKKRYRVEIGPLPRKVAGESMSILRVMTNLLFVDNSRAFLYFTYIFLGNDILNDKR